MLGPNIPSICYVRSCWAGRGSRAGRRGGGARGRSSSTATFSVQLQSQPPHLVWPFAPQHCASGLLEHVVVCQANHPVAVCNVYRAARLQGRVCCRVAPFRACRLQGEHRPHLVELSGKAQQALLLRVCTELLCVCSVAVFALDICDFVQPRAHERVLRCCSRGSWGGQPIQHGPGVVCRLLMP